MRAQLAIFALMLTPVPAQAQPAELPIPDATALDRLCSPRGTMQFAFGETGVPGSSKLEATLGHGFDLPPGFGAFVSAQPRATEWSGQLMEMTYSVKLPQSQAAGYTAQLAEALAAAGWTPADMPEGQQPLYLMGYGGGRTFQKPVTEEATTRVLAHLDYLLGELTLSCGRDDLLRRHAGEAFGELPPGTPRPSVPEVALPPVQTAADCNDPARLEAVASSMNDRSADSFIGAMLARTTWRDRLTTWMTWKLETSGKIDKRRMLTLLMNSAGKASPGGNLFATIQMLPELFDKIEMLAVAEKIGDRAGYCRGIVDFRGWIARVDGITLRQTQATQAALAAEAKRLGVSLD